MDEPLAKRPRRPTGLKLLDVTFRPSDAKECKEADVAPTPATCRDPDGAASARFDAVLGQLHCKR